MEEVIFKTNMDASALQINDLVPLYESVGWTRYTAFPDKLFTALQNSTYVMTAHVDDQLIGLVRGLSDGISIHFIQDLLVHPGYQRRGIGRNLLNRVVEEYPTIHKHILLTDDENFQGFFYESLGFQNINLFEPKLSAYLKM